VVNSVFADPVLARIHQRGDLGGVGTASGVGDGGHLRGPRARGERDQGAGAVAEAVVDDGGDVAGSGQVPFGDRGGQDSPVVRNNVMHFNPEPVPADAVEKLRYILKLLRDFGGLVAP